MNEIFKALNDETRRNILTILSEKGSLSASEIHDQFEMSKPSISNHLTILRNAGLVTSEKKGQYIYYTLHTAVLQDLLVWMIKLNK
ncbi:transcriptional regulator [Sporosarcina sp. P37]|uniref:autorepressor SdpR family transcription factor n=1 Tax=unclassified Sporosarcina TaxID=2647733 RepID=UPI0009BE4AE8|nr:MULTISPECIES: autorepressor SdpR family transcription factor [unclassified Sporosarcina]ARD46964.1 transcriptional regulator [Sporosarcina sp. P33]ARK23488.1 transcriptional regulator [Sporosarcina sp. P37]PID18699.1 ArsR family transcriptional regulator [Sporosarcina sp. P35]